MPRLQLLSFLRYESKTNRAGGKFTLHPPRLGLNKPSAEIAGLFKYVRSLEDKKH